jgi:group I intron endonuclease
MEIHYIYVFRNKINLKIYVGQTKNLKGRLSRHKYEAFTKLNKKPLYNSIRKYGLNNFELIEIERHSKEYIDEAEIFWVAYFQSNNLDLGYNLTAGGQLTTGIHLPKPKIPPMLGRHHSQEAKQKMSEDRIGDKNAFYGKRHSEQSKQLMSENPNRKYFGSDNPFYHIKFQGEDNKTSKLTNEIVLEVRKLHNEGMTFVQISKIYNVSESTISRVVKRLTWKHI